MNLTPANKDIYIDVKKENIVKIKLNKVIIIRWVFYIGIILFLISTYTLKFDYLRLFTGTLQFLKLIIKMFPPDASDWKSILSSMIQTFQMTWIGTFTAAIISFVISFFGARNTTPSSSIRWIARSFGALMRAIPVVVWCIIFVAAVGLGPLPGIMAIAVHSTGMLIKVFSDSIEEIDERVLEAMRSTGANILQIIIRGIIPSTFTSFMSWFLLRLDIDLRYATVLGMVGAGGIGFELIYSIRKYQMNRTLFIIICILVMLLSIEYFNNYVKRRIAKINESR